MSTLDITDVRTAIESANAIFMRTFNSGDAAGMASFYTIDGQILPPNADSVSGEEGFQAFRKGLIDMGIKEVEFWSARLKPVVRPHSRFLSISCMAKAELSWTKVNISSFGKILTGNGNYIAISLIAATRHPDNNRVEVSRGKIAPTYSRELHTSQGKM